MSFWTDRRVTVTGGAGFLGSHIVQRLRERGCSQVTVPLREDYDLVEPTEAKRLMDDTRPDLVIHAAARVGGIGANRDRPAQFFYENAVMGIHLMHEAWQHGVAKFVTIGTTCSYPAVTEVPFQEKNLWNGYPDPVTGPYGLAKKALLVQGMCYRKQYGFNAIYLIPTNLFGPGDNYDPTSSHVIPALIRKFVEAVRGKQDSVTIWGGGEATRDFLFVTDAADGILLAAEHYDEPDPINLGSGVEVSIRSLAELISRLAGFRGEILWDPSQPEGQMRRRLDISQAEACFGFRARGSLEENLRITIDSVRDNLSQPEGHR